MIRFYECPENGNGRVFRVSENGVEKGEGVLEPRGERIYIRLKADAQTRDFLFRSLLNVCRDLKDKICVLETPLTKEYIEPFGFKAGKGGYIVKTEGIVLGGSCKK